MTTRIACIGAGNIGRAWAMIFARGGHEVALYDEKPAALDTAMGATRSGLDDQARLGLIDDPKAVLARIKPALVLKDALADVAHVQENVYEDLAVKRTMFETLDRLTPKDAVIASSVSSIPVSQFMEGLPGSARCIGAHPVNPPNVIPLVEIIMSPSTAESTYERTAALMEAIGQVPVRLNREILGYVLNRLQFALINEALHLVDQGYVSAIDCDKIIKHGLGRRWAFMGPFETNHLNASGGIREYYTKFGPTIQGIIKELFLTPHPAGPEIVEKLAAEIEAATPIDQVPARQAWRDRQLASLARHLADMAEREAKN
ncbi:MAG: 3-hydroxyacyl-CoA dehydrogenase [Alphaproteobacteria bacterium]